MREPMKISVSECEDDIEPIKTHDPEMPVEIDPEMQVEIDPEPQRTSEESHSEPQ